MKECSRCSLCVSVLWLTRLGYLDKSMSPSKFVKNLLKHKVRCKKDDNHLFSNYAIRKMSNLLIVN